MMKMTTTMIMGDAQQLHKHKMHIICLFFYISRCAAETTQRHTNPWNINMIFMDWLCYSVGRMARVDNKACTTMQSCS